MQALAQLVGLKVTLQTTVAGDGDTGRGDTGNARKTEKLPARAGDASL